MHPLRTSFVSSDALSLASLVCVGWQVCPCAEPSVWGHRIAGGPIVTHASCVDGHWAHAGAQDLPTLAVGPCVQAVCPTCEAPRPASCSLGSASGCGRGLPIACDADAEAGC